MFSTTIRRCGPGAAALACVAVLAACGTHPAGARSRADPSASGTSAGVPVASATPAPKPSATPSATPSPSVTSTAHGPSTAGVAACRRDNVTAAMVHAGGAAGTSGYTIHLTSHGRTTCTLSANPKLYYTTSAGTVRAIPVAVVPGAKSFALPAGRIAETIVLIVDGHGGYATGSPNCAHPVIYRGISVWVGDGRLALPHFELDVTCDGVRDTGWNFAP
ncbi:MAG TPA: DUF4232 domain-containing protein [Micromonosporaceae bacterium]|nr:DUF4232 domain-containing protein [Micromonosporaceae bacterium]